MNEIFSQLKTFFDANSRLSALETKLSASKGVGRRIVCAANKYGEYIIPGVRHFDLIMRHIMTPSGIADQIQGFLDNQGNFLTGEEALPIAEAAGQIIRRVCGDKHRLYSDSLY